jgi:hypothetical protein
MPLRSHCKTLSMLLQLVSPFFANFRVFVSVVTTVHAICLFTQTTQQQKHTLQNGSTSERALPVPYPPPPPRIRHSILKAVLHAVVWGFPLRLEDPKSRGEWLDLQCKQGHSCVATAQDVLCTSAGSCLLSPRNAS